MVRRGHYFCLRLDGGQPFRIVCGRLREHFDCGVPIELSVLSSIDLTHAARANGREDFVRAELVSWLKRHVTNSIQFSGSTGRQALGYALRSCSYLPSRGAARILAARTP